MEESGFQMGSIEYNYCFIITGHCCLEDGLSSLLVTADSCQHNRIYLYVLLRLKYMSGRSVFKCFLMFEFCCWSLDSMYKSFIFGWNLLDIKGCNKYLHFVAIYQFPGVCLSFEINPVMKALKRK